MNMPGFTAETSLYQTNNHYRFATGGSFLSNGNTTVIPQDCGIGEGFACGGFIHGGVGLCSYACFVEGDLAQCAGCWVLALGALYATCKDCIPAAFRTLIDLFESSGGVFTGGGGGGGVGGSRPCCPRGHFCRGRCTKVPGMGLVCEGECVRPGEE